MNPKLKISMIVGIVLLSVILSSPLTVAQASGSVNYTPSVFSSGVQTLTDISGGNFGASTTVFFYISSAPSSSGIIGGYIGSYSLPSGTTSINNAHVTLTIPSSLQGPYYLLASDSASPSSTSAEFTSASPVTITSLRPSVSVSGTYPTTSGTVSGNGWDPSASVSIYLSGPQGSSILSTPLTTVTTTSSGSIPVGTTFTVPDVADGTYSVVAYESSASSPNSGITADSSMSISPYISVSPYDISGALDSSFTLYGYGFPSLASIVADSITVSSTKTTNPEVPVSSSGSFSVSASLAAAITSSGSYSVALEYNTSQPFSQSNAIFVSIPNPLSLGFTFTTPSTAYPNSQYTATMYNFPANSPVTLSLGPISLGQATTDSNGFAEITGSIPALPAGSYRAAASSSDMFVSKSVTLSSYFEVTDAAGQIMTSSSEYFPSSGVYTVSAFGLTPGAAYTLSDTWSSSSSMIKSVTSGTIVSASSFELKPAGNGTLIFSFVPNFSSSATSTSTISLKHASTSVSPYSSNGYGYTPVQSPRFSPSTVGQWEQTLKETLTVSNLMPAGSQIYPGLSTSYNVYLGSSEIQFTVGASTTLTSTLSSTSTSASISFTVPSVASGVYNLSITYSSQTVSNSLFSQPEVVSTPATTVSSGNVQAVPFYSSGTISGYYIIGYAFYQSASIKLFYYTYSGISSSSGYTENPVYGSFVYTLSLPAEPSGTYGIIAQASYTSSGITTTYNATSSYSVSPSFATTTSSGGMNSQVTFNMKGFEANSYYYIYFANHNVLTAQTDDTGAISSGNFYVPVMPEGTYNITVVQVSNSAQVASSRFNITSSTTLSLNGGSFAFPGQEVNFSWKPSTVPNSPGASTSSGPYYGNIYLTVYMNGSSIFTTTASISDGYINGSFVMPNGLPGNYWDANLSWEQDEYTTATISGSITTTTVTSVFHRMAPGNGAFVELVSGNGAMITGISSGQIADITAAVNSSISASLKVPLSQLNATISSIEGSLATIKTSFGTMQTSLTALNASIAAVNGTLATLNTSIGTVTTSLSSINATVISIKGGVGTVQTSIGTLTGAVTSISGNAVTIQTSVGTLKADLSSVNSKLDNVTNYGMIFDIVIIALIAVTLGLAVAGLLSTRDMKKRFGMKKE